MLFQYNEGRKIIKIGNDLDCLQRVKERFDLDGEIVLQKYNGRFPFTKKFGNFSLGIYVEKSAFHLPQVPF